MSKNRYGKYKYSKRLFRKTRGGKLTPVQKVIFVILSALVLISIFISLNEKYLKIKFIPTWDEIFIYAGLNDDYRISSKVTTIDGDVSVHFIDVGQGDSQLIMTPTANVLIDTGEKEYYSTVIKYLRQNEIEKLDYVILTHPHSDHAAGFVYIIDEIPAETLIIPKIADEMLPTTGTFMRMLSAIENGDVKAMYAEPGMEIDLGEAKIEIIAPVKDYDDLNNYSIVCKLIHQENSFLFTGDIESEAENDIVNANINIEADVLKVAHHGSKGSSKKKFLYNVEGRYAVINVGYPNGYNHPRGEVLERLQDFGYVILRTDMNGNIVFVSDGITLEVFAEKASTLPENSGQDNEENE